jgi:hypothetical protein
MVRLSEGAAQALLTPEGRDLHDAAAGFGVHQAGQDLERPGHCQREHLLRSVDSPVCSANPGRP